MLERAMPGADRRVQFMATCLCDAFYDEAAVAAVEVLEHAGCVVEFPEGQTCCGQPAFNGGDWPASRQVVRHTVQTFAGDLPVVVPSGSCAAMLLHGAPLEFEREGDAPAVAALGRRTWELCDFLVHGLGLTSWGGRYPARVVFHRSCHSRGTRSSAAAELLLRSIDGLELIEFGEGEQCCGFGGTFSVGFPHISGAMGTLKLEHLLERRPEIILSADLSCLMHLGGLAERAGQKLRTMHVAQLLAAARNPGPRSPRLEGLSTP